MDWTKPLGLLGVVVLALLVIGALVSLVINTLSGAAAIVTVALLVVLIAGVAHVGGRSKRWRQNPYW
ncbi:MULTISPECIES: hypothetical protein [unclassified Haladaptatus]|uniref:hypothetical protein n=1 Tax=unclassified Haladaptatus TaxID=2622732 RepID=UPI00209BC0FD|nr:MULTISPECIES: hypothetical protein [unclassified Haladaptatus]MCO8243818.1 hypothetical protein [Haladaptatus sp. AB643]MCO8253431.1 hypothetical protein [Haladaptatus sp. AB618]